MGSGRSGLRWARAIGTTVLAGSLALAGVPALAVSSSPTASAVDWSSRGPTGWSQAAQRTVDSDPASEAESAGVVLVDTQLAYQGASGAGTGLVLTSDGEVVTNYHVVEGATTITVTVASTGRSYSATVVGHSAKSDVALLQLRNAKGLQTASIDDDTVRTGDAVTAVGNAGGTGTLTAADGTVTSLSSTITTASEGSIASETLNALIETDADVVAGDSGGPLLDAAGEVVGIDTAASSGEDIDGYAIPIQQALTVVRQIQDGNQSTQVQIGAAAFLGVLLGDPYDATTGVPVSGVVDGSAAARLGLTGGDVVTRIGATKVATAAQLGAAIADHRPGEHVTVTWTDSAGSEHSKTAALTASPEA